MAKPNPILDAENLRAVFNRIMKEKQLKPEDVKKERCKVNIYSNGQFACENCEHVWNSKFSWIRFNLSEMKIEYRWKMKCRMCLYECQPTFTIEQIENMYECAVLWYKGETVPRNINIGYRYRDRPQPHLPQLCEKCKWGIDKCWLRGWH